MDTENKGGDKSPLWSDYRLEQVYRSSTLAEAIRKDEFYVHRWMREEYEKELSQSRKAVNTLVEANEKLMSEMETLRTENSELKQDVVRLAQMVLRNGVENNKPVPPHEPPDYGNGVDPYRLVERAVSLLLSMENPEFRTEYKSMLAQQATALATVAGVMLWDRRGDGA